MAELFPNGVAPYLIGGAFLGLAVSAVFLLQGVRMGASGVLTALWGGWVRGARFDAYRPQRTWRLQVTLGMILGAALYTATLGDAFVTDVSTVRLLLGGFLVGLGTRAARGCTSGHGICGLAAASRPSLVHVAIFMTTAIATAAIAGARS